MNRGLWLKTFAVLVLLGGLALLVRAKYGHLFDAAAASALLNDVRSSPWAVPAFLVAYVALTTLFAPAAVFHVAAGAVWGFALGFPLNLAAFHLTSNLQFLATRKLGANWAPRALGEARVRALSQRLERDGLRAAMMVRLLPLPNMAVNIAAGLSPIRWRDFALGTFIGTLPLITVHTALANALARGAEGSREEALKWLVVGAVVVALLAVASRRFSPRTGGRDV